MKLVLIVAALFACFAYASGAVPAYFLTDAVRQGAMCLDGTPAAYYWEKGTGDGARKWYVHHEGGGWCPSFENCYARSLTDLGSSKNYPREVGGLGGGYFSNDPSVNPMMYNWNKVYMKYCDGGSFSGNSTGAWQGKPLYFRGKLILEAMRASLLAQGLKDASDLVVSGCSAGGLATFLHVDWWHDAMPASAHVVGLPDSGFFLDYESPAKQYRTQMQWVFANMKAESGVNQRCVQAYSRTQDTWKCMFAQYTSPHIQTPIFPLQSEYDSWQISEDLASKDPAVINEYGRNLTTLVKTMLLQPLRANGVFLDSCYHHCGEWGNIVIDGKNQAHAFQDWYNAPSTARHDYLQDKEYPCVACCAKSSLSLVAPLRAKKD